MSLRFKHLLTATLLTAGVVGSTYAQAPKITRIRGEVVSLNGDQLTVHRRSGDTVVIALKPDAGVGSVRKIQLSDIKPGEFIGTAAKTDVDGKLVALEVLVFPEAARGTGEGHYDWDLGSNSTMTNANVDSVVQSNSGRQLTLSYKGGSNQVTVPPEVPVVTLAPATRADLLAGKAVFVVASDDGANHYTGLRVIVEKDGVKPPM